MNILMNPRTPHRDEKTMFNKTILNYSAPVIVPLPPADVNDDKEGLLRRVSTVFQNLGGWDVLNFIEQPYQF